jgi:choline dehydrogenase-like flavoprotein
MTPEPFFDPLILVQRLAGSLLARTLAQRGGSVCVLESLARLANHLEAGGDLPARVDVRRYACRLR